MINEYLNKTISAIRSDAEFIKDFPQKLATPGVDVDYMIRKASILILRIIDYYVTSSLIDMDADISRLCQQSPAEAMKYREELNAAGLNLKNNYQYLFKEGTIYTDEMSIFPFQYAMLLGITLDVKHGADINELKPIPFGAIFLDYSEFELIYTDDDNILEQKFQKAKDLIFTLETVKDFINKCFEWSDKIQECLDRAHSNKTVINIDPNKLYRLHIYCNGQAYTSTTPEKFSTAIMGYSLPDFHVIHKDFFYSVLYAIYMVLGPLCPRDAWLRSVLSKFELPENDYYNAKSRLEGKGKHTSKLIERYLEIRRILEE